MRKYIFSVNRTTDPSLLHKPFFSPMETGTKKENSYHWKGKISITLSRRRRFLLRARFCYRQCMTEKISNRYFRIPELSKTFDVAFFPEGGHAAQSTTIKMAFKAIDADGLSTEVEGQVFDEEGQVCADFKSQHWVWGVFGCIMFPEKSIMLFVVTEQAFPSVLICPNLLRVLSP